MNKNWASVSSTSLERQGFPLVIEALNALRVIRGRFSSSSEPPPMPGIYWFQREGTSMVLRLDVRAKDGVLTVWVGLPRSTSDELDGSLVRSNGSSDHEIIA
jgi:hypothetical protein